MISIARCILAWTVLVAVCLTSATATLAAETPSALLIESCSVFDPESGAMLPARNILIRGDKIISVTPADENLDIPSDATKIDGKGKFALPGLIDAHTHSVHVLDYARVTGDEVLPLYLAAGITSIRSTGEEIVAATLVARWAMAHPESSPRVFTCSPLLDADPPIHKDIGKGITDPAQVPAILDEHQHGQDLCRHQPTDRQGHH